MRAYVFQAALHCHDCGARIRADICNAGNNPDDATDESSYDSDDFPKGPYPDGGGEADTPQHCDTCGVFLENPLTPDGDDYTREAAKEFETRPDMSWEEIAVEAEKQGNHVVAEWIRFYFAWG